MNNFIRAFFILSLMSPSVGIFAMYPQSLKNGPVAHRLRSAKSGAIVRNLFSKETAIPEGKQEDVSVSENVDNEATSHLWVEGRQEAVIEAINQAEKYIKLATPFFSDLKAQKALIAAHERGVDVDVKIASKAKVDPLLKAGIAVEIVPGLHAKTIITDKVALVGSDNLSSISSARQTELLLQTTRKQGPKYHKRSIARFERIGISPRNRGKTPKKATPKRHTVHRGHTGYKANRLDKFVDFPSAGNRVDIASMTFDSDRFVSQVEKVYAEVPFYQRPVMRFFLDKSALKHPDLLARIKKAGEDDVKIYIFNADGSKKIWKKFPDIMHQKYVARMLVGNDGTQQKYAVISTGNLTNQSDLDINIDSHHPGDAALYDGLIARGNMYAASSDWTEYQLPQE